MTCRLPRRVVFGALALPLLAPKRAAAQMRPPDILDTWRDPARQRDIPVHIRLPAGVAPAPAVIVSHGLGGSREGLIYLGEALAAAGFAAIHLQHAGTDRAVLSAPAGGPLGLAMAMFDPRNALDRLQDVAFALDELARRAVRPGPLGNRLDLTRTAIAGHSLGAWTVTHMLGEALPPLGVLAQTGLALPDPRLRAGIALSPVPPLLEPAATAYARVRAPILHVTGTADRGVVEAQSPEDRTLPYRGIASPGVLVVLAGADHAAFAGEPGIGTAWNNPTYHARTASLSVLFLRAVLLGDAAARALLVHGAPLARGDRMETKGMAGAA
jgi:predicted dienelactone hydrolase